jgi:hypothetical protein
LASSSLSSDWPAASQGIGVSRRKFTFEPGITCAEDGQWATGIALRGAAGPTELVRFVQGYGATLTVDAEGALRAKDGQHVPLAVLESLLARIADLEAIVASQA